MTEMLNKWLKNRENLFSASDIKTVDIRKKQRTINYRNSGI